MIGSKILAESLIFRIVLRRCATIMSVSTAKDILKSCRQSYFRLRARNVPELILLTTLSIPPDMEFHYRKRAFVEAELTKTCRKSA
jgi:hypothetical protein